MGLALGLYNELTVERLDREVPLSIEISGEGAASLPRDESNLWARAAGAVFSERWRSRIRFRARNRIPVARGLGSSGAAIVAGLFAANRLLGDGGLSREQLFEYAVALEGHPDNVAPAIYGGARLSIRESKTARCFALKTHPELAAALCIPDFQLETARARAVLPATVLREAAVENVARAMLLAAALEGGRWADLATAMGDRLHQPYRAALIPGLDDVLAAAVAAGCGAALSGSGSAVLALGRRGPSIVAAGAAMQRAWRKRGVSSRVVVLPVDRRGVRVFG